MSNEKTQIESIELTIENEKYTIINEPNKVKEFYDHIVERSITNDNINIIVIDDYIHNIITNELRISYIKTTGYLTCIAFNDKIKDKIYAIDTFGNKHNITDIVNKMKIIGIEEFDKFKNINIATNRLFTIEQFKKYDSVIFFLNDIFKVGLA